jgi:DNA-binding transcriptional LysR family regulator
MELMQLEMFVAVVEERSFLRAAERVFRTQPAVSLGVRKLEGRIGVPLIDRSGRRSGRVTPAGELLYEYATRILGLRDEALSAVKKEDGTAAGSLRIGVTSGAVFQWIPQLTRRFCDQYPNTRLEIHFDRPVRFFPELTARRLDIVLLSGRPKLEAQNKGFIVTRVRSRPSGAFWIVRRKLGQSALAYAFEQDLVRHFESLTGTRDPKHSELRTVSISKGGPCVPKTRVNRTAFLGAGRG